MSPRILSMLNGFKPLSFDYIIEGKGITVKNLHWTEMGNGAMRLEAELNGTPFRATFAKKSKEYPAITDTGTGTCFIPVSSQMRETVSVPVFVTVFDYVWLKR